MDIFGKRGIIPPTTVINRFKSVELQLGLGGYLKLISHFRVPEPSIGSY